MSKKPQRIHFGKHRGKRFQELPMGYLFWLLANASQRETVEAAENAISDRGFAEAKARRQQRKR